MAHSLDKHYNDFGGIDTRSNKLLQSPDTCREGSKNFRYTFEDNLSQRYGFQHKTNLSGGCEWGLIEYKYQDLNTGQARIQILGINESGYLSVLKKHKLKMTFNASTVAYYSFYYNGTTYIIEFLDSTFVVLGSVNISLVMTMDQLETAINALALTGLTADIVDEDGISISSSELAYHLDVVYREEIASSGIDVEYNEVGYWSQINTPDGSVPFPTVPAFKNDPKYEGPTWINAANSIYITDGAFPMKYDGYKIYRSGMPRILPKGASLAEESFSGHKVVLSGAVGAGFDTGIHRVRLQYRYKDPNGVIIYGRPMDDTEDGLYNGSFTINRLANERYDLEVKEIKNTNQFPIWGCKLNGSHDFDVSTTATVDAGHNIEVGMYLRLPFSSGGLQSRPLFVSYKKVTAVTATTVTIESLMGSTYIIPNSTVLNGCYLPENFKDYIPLSGPNNNLAVDWYGPYMMVLGTKTGETDTYYEIGVLPVPYTSAQQYKEEIGTADVNMVVEFDEESEYGDDLPKACRYLSKWQDQLIVAGRPYDAENLVDLIYPTNFFAVAINPFIRPFLEYGEPGLCAYQSIYWENPLYPEGFAQTGENEESFETDKPDEVRGIGSNKEALFVFKSRGMGYLTGELATGDIVKEILETDIGATCHKGISSVEGSLLFLDEIGGFYSVIAGRLPQYLGYAISDNIKNNSQKPRNQFLNLRRAVSTEHTLYNWYICYVPAGKQEDGETQAFPDPTVYSKAFVYDYADTRGKIRNAWYVWQGINAAGGILSSDDVLYISQKSTSAKHLWKMKTTGSKYDMCDHTTAIEFLYKGAFLHYGFPTIDKHWVGCIISSIQGDFSLTVQQYANFLDYLVGDLSINFLAESTSKKAIKEKVKANIEKLSSLSWGFYNNSVNELVRIQGWDVEYSADFDKGEPKR